MPRYRVTYRTLPTVTCNIVGTSSGVIEAEDEDEAVKKVTLKLDSYDGDFDNATVEELDEDEE